MSEKRLNVLSWDDFFMSTAFLAAQRSKDPATQVGACIVDENNIIVGIGYNGFPRGCSDDEFPWGKDSPNKCDNKYVYVSHAELNAILNKNCASVKGCTIYVSLFPCNECAKIIIQSGIKKVVYKSDKYKDADETVASKKMLDAAKIILRQYTPQENITIDFSTIPNLPDLSKVST